MSTTRKIVSWALRLVTAAILFQTLFFKFSGAEESVYIFSRLGLEPWGRIGSGVAELVCCVLLLAPRTVVFGAGLSLAVISGALVSHLTRLGIVVLDDGGLLFTLALVVFVASAVLLWLHRAELPVIGGRLGGGGGGHRHGRDDAAGAGGSTYRVLIVGGGFGGTYTALALERALAANRDVRVTLINRGNSFLFTPMLHEVAASDLDVTNIVSPLRKLLRRVDFFDGEVLGIDLRTRRVTVRHGSDGHTHELGYDRLVLALGSVTNFYGLPGLADHAMTMKILGDAIDLRNRLISRLEEADTECAASVRRPLLTVVVAGGGFAGVETVAGVNDFLREALPYYPHLDAADLRVVLVHAGDVILPELGEKLGRYAQRQLGRRGVEIRTGTRVARLDAGRVELSDGTALDARTVVWTAGTAPHPLLDVLGCARERGRLRVDERLQLHGYPDVFALGDCAAVPDSVTGGFHPPTAQHALRQGKVVAANLLASLRGETLRPFRFSTLGQLAAIGRRTGVARILGVNFSGFVAWWLWRTIYLAKLPRFEKKLRVALDWTLDVFFSKDLVQFSTERTRAAGAEIFPPVEHESAVGV